MAKKDFSQVNTGRVYDAIEEATAEAPNEAEAAEVQDAQEVKQKRKAGVNRQYDNGRAQGCKDA